MLKKSALSVILTVLVLTALCGCSLTGKGYADIEGYKQAALAQKLYEKLESGHFYMTDNVTGEKTTEFTFKYRSDGNLTYMYTLREADEVYFEYHNGSELNKKKGGDKGWSFFSAGDSDYVSYSKKNKHPYTSGRVISVNAYAITEGRLETTESGERIYFKYNPQALSEAFEGMGELKSFESVIWLREDGHCVRLDQKGVFLNGGEEKVYDYSMVLDSMNAIDEVKRTDSF